MGFSRLGGSWNPWLLGFVEREHTQMLNGNLSCGMSYLLVGEMLKWDDSIGDCKKKQAELTPSL